MSRCLWMTPDDGTAAVLESWFETGHPLRAVRRVPAERSDGLAGAISMGISSTTAPLIAVIDGDPQHPPEVLEKLVVPLVAGRADVSVGSRYVSGRTSEGLDGQWRVFGSRSVRAITQLLFPEARPLTDHAGRSSVFDSQVVDGYDLRPEVVEMLVGVPVRGHWKESHEVRYRFAGRVHGASTAGIRPGLRLLSHHARLWCSARLPDSVRADLSVSRAR